VLSDICRVGPRLQSLLASLGSLLFEISYSENGFTGIFYKNENEKKAMFRPPN
jgi:hypothetical protein